MKNIERKWQIRIIGTLVSIGMIIFGVIVNTITAVDVTAILMDKLGPTGGSIAVLLLAQVAAHLRNEYKLKGGLKGMFGAEKKDREEILLI